MTWQEWKFRWQMRRQRRRQRRYDKAVEKCRKAAERDGVAFDRLWVIYDPATTKGEWRFLGACFFLAVGAFALVSPLYFGWHDMLPGVLQVAFDWAWSNALTIVIFVIGLPAVLFGAMMSNHD